MNKIVKEKVKFIYSPQNEGLSPSCIAQSFDGLAQFHGTVFGFFGSLQNCFRIFNFFSDLSSRNAHLVHQNWYRISFTRLNVDHHASTCHTIGVLRIPSGLAVTIALWNPIAIY
jgi:hypothetical protein